MNEMNMRIMHTFHRTSRANLYIKYLYYKFFKPNFKVKVFFDIRRDKVHVAYKEKDFDSASYKEYLPSDQTISIPYSFVLLSLLTNSFTETQILMNIDKFLLVDKLPYIACDFASDLCRRIYPALDKDLVEHLSFSVLDTEILNDKSPYDIVIM